MDRLVGLLSIYAHGTARLEPSRTDPAKGLSIADVRDRAEIADRLADACEEQERGEAAEFRWQAKRSAETGEVSNSVSSAGEVLRQKTQAAIGGVGLPLSAMSNMAAMLRGDVSTRSRYETEGRAERAMPLRKRQEIQKMLRSLSAWQVNPARLSR